MNVPQQVKALFTLHGHKVYTGPREEPVTALAHALQCAQLAEWACADNSLVVAALLHDIGHFVEISNPAEQDDDLHEVRAMALLAPSFHADVIEPIRLHVQAKRYLVAVDRRYAQTLSTASLHSLGMQGGAMSAGEVSDFEDERHAPAAVALRRWDDLAKVPGKGTPSLAYYLTLVEAELHHRAGVARHRLRAANV